MKKCGQVLDAAGMPIVGGRKADESRHNAATMREARLPFARPSSAPRLVPSWEEVAGSEAGL